MKQKILAVSISICFTSLAMSQQNIPYQNPQAAAAVNAAPTSAPSGLPQQAGMNDPNMQAIQGAQVSDTVDTNAYGQKVYTRNQLIKVPTNNQEDKQAQYHSLSPAEKLWNVPADQIRQIRQIHNSKMDAINMPLNPSKCDKAKTIQVGSITGEIPLLRIDTQNLSTVMMVDAMGNAWDIEYIINKSNINIPIDTENPKASSFSINSSNPYNQGSFSVKLKGYDVPIPFSFVSNQKVSDCFVIAQINKAGPNTSVETNTLNPNAMSSELNSALYGVAPKDSRPLKTSDGSVSAWLLKDGDVLIRTKYRLMSPAPKASTRLPDGVMVFKVQYSNSYRYRYNDLISSVEVSK